MRETRVRILVPRPPDRSGALVRALRIAGYEPDLVPLIRIEPAEDADLIIDLLGAMVSGRFGWLAVTSSSAVKPLVDAAGNLGLELAEALRRARVAAVGNATAAALRAAGVGVDLIATTRSAQGLLAVWPRLEDEPERPQRILLPHGDLAEPTLVNGLRAAGWSVRTVIAYRTTPVPPPPRVIAAWARGDYGGVVLTSSSMVRQLVATLGRPRGDLTVCCIGPTTAATARELGLEVRVAHEPSPAGLVEALGPIAAGTT